MTKVYADELYRFFSEIAEAATRLGESDGLKRIEFARKHYLFPPTSEFFAKLGAHRPPRKPILRLTTRLIMERAEALCEQFSLGYPSC